MKLIKTKCALCGSYGNYKVVYRKNFRMADLKQNIFSARRLPDRKHYQMVRCLQDGLLRANPILETKQLKHLYEESSFTYQDEVDNLTTTYMNVLKDVLPNLAKNDKILEIGCGNGFLLNALYKHGYKNVYGVEPSTNSVKLANKRIKNKIKTEMFGHGLFRNNTFGLICFFQTLDHVSNPNTFLQTCYSLLKNNGYIIAFNHNENSFSAKLLEEKSPIIDIEHPYLYNNYTIKVLFQQNKFQVVSIYNPSNTLSIKHFLWLLPIPRFIKTNLSNHEYSLLRKSLKIKLGNLCIIAKKAH